MLTKSINLINFKYNKNSSKIHKKLKSIISEKNEVIKSLEKNYKNSFKKKI